MGSAATTGLDEKLEKMSEEHTAAITQLKKGHAEAMSKVEEDHKSLQAEQKSKFDAQAQENAASKSKLQNMMAKHADDLKAHYEGKFKVMKDENESYLKQMQDE